MKEQSTIGTMKFVIRHEYECAELLQYNPMTFEAYLLRELAKLRVKCTALESNGFGSMTVPQLRKVLAGLPDDHVVTYKIKAK